MATFWEKYKDPRWQKKRLEIMEAWGWACQNCGDKETTLNVHHKLYRKGADPWDYPMEHLECLCEPCHEAKHASKALLNQVIAETCMNLDDITGLICGFLDANVDMDPGIAEMGRQASPQYYEIGLAAASVQHEVAAQASLSFARAIVREVWRDKFKTPAIENALQSWKDVNGQS